MPSTAAGERTVRLRRAIAASTFAAAVLALAVGGCSAGSGGGSSPWAGGGGVAADTSSASPSASGDLIEPTDADTDFDDETSPYDTYSYDDDYTEDPYDTYDPDDTYDPYDTDDPYDDGGLYPTLPNATPYAADTCFNGPRITSTTPIDVYNMDEVSCSASDAHYKVVKTILESTDLDDCEDVDDAEYAFSETDTDGYGVTTWSAVYCLKGLGSYAAD